MDSTSAPVGFPSTLWSVVRDAAGPDGRRESLAVLVERYWKPVYWFLRLSHDRDPASAMDLAQAFFLHVLESDFASKASPDRGRFRAFLKTSVRNFVINRAEADQALRRGGGRWTLPLGEAEAASIPADWKRAGPDQVFEREWRAAVVRQATLALKKRLEEGGKGAYYQVFELHDLAPAEPPSYRSIADRLGLGEDAVRNYLRVAREIFRDCVRDEVRQTVGSASDAGEELADLFGGQA